MKHQVRGEALADWQVGVLGVPVLEESWGDDPALLELDAALDGQLKPMLVAEGFKASRAKSRLVHTLGRVAPARILIYGLGKAGDLRLQYVRDFAHTVVKAAEEAKSKHAGAALPALGSLDAPAAASEALLAAELGTYRFDRYKGERDEHGLETMSWRLGDGVELGPAKQLQGVAAGVARARDLVNEPAGVCTPGMLEEQAREIAARYGMGLTVFGRAELEEKEMGCILAVARGSDLDPRLHHQSYKPAGAPKGRIAFVGKGITFDSGGYDLKPPEHMLDMKIDMAGAAAVLGAMDAVGAVAPDVEVHGIVPTCENLVNGRAYKPGDVLRAYKGKTIEIANTDAEGRLILADALGYATDLKPDAIVDLATLTGACAIALGDYTAGLFGADGGLTEQLLAAAEEVDEAMWRLPLDAKLRKQLESPVADLKNVGKRFGGAITAALFLKEFVGDVPWAHIDIAGPAALDEPVGALPKGGTGFGVRSLVRLAERFEKP